MVSKRNISAAYVYGNFHQWVASMHPAGCPEGQLHKYKRYWAEMDAEYYEIAKKRIDGVSN